MKSNRGDKSVPPGNGPYSVEYVEVVGGPDYLMPMPPTKTRAPIHRPRNRDGDFEMGSGGPIIDPATLPPATPDRMRGSGPLIPTPDEVASLPRSAQEAFAARCAARVPSATTAAATAHALLERATLDTPLLRQLRCLRRDFEKLRHFARQFHWTDDTPVPPDSLGRLWPPGVAPDESE